ncbi:GNAT family N-acetyltransferase [Alkaliphilus oremlandii]|uniref:GCN5-related N-acetyltransferase n=1 Tax=Alkaliphilus oremlandii (strain OhILAs) TaxID=350688 RepID=A8MKC2_ALKOO|nr:GNAT family N-acetyltransferase [Alkaliphilus oremlandii]ABW20254.1 GCN5-related N-acetyltransferase [Alkaliphilus oremlandii OhILAs]
MIQYRNCYERMDAEKIFDAFQIGFSDYRIQLQLSQEAFIKRFFGPEGNQLENSFIALDGEEPVGLILGGIKNFDGLRTIRCGALCIHPDYRGKGISQELFKLHKALAVAKGCKQMFLEVIVGNDRAIKFYKNLGYHKIYDLSYFSCSDVLKLQTEVDSRFKIDKIDFYTIQNLAEGMKDIHINWQNDFDYMSKLEGLNHYGVYEGQQLMGALSINANGKMMFIYTDPNYRNMGIGKTLVGNAVRDLALSKVSISFPNNASMEGFVKHAGFQRDTIAQYEMYLTL